MNHSQSSFDQSKSYLAHVVEGDKIQIWDVKTGKISLQLNLPVQLTAEYTTINWSPLESNKNRPAKKKRKKEQQQKQQTITGKSRYLGCGTKNGETIIWDILKGELLHQIKGGAGSVNALAFSRSDNRNVFIAPQNGSIQLWNFHKPALIKKFKQAQTNASSMTTDPKGLYLVTASTTIQVWDVASTELVATLQGHLNAVQGLHFTSDAEYLLSVSNDRFVNIWKMKNVQKNKSPSPFSILSLDSPPVSIDLITFQPDVYHVLAVTESGGLFIFEIDIQAQLESNHESQKKKKKRSKKRMTEEQKSISIAPKLHVSQTKGLASACFSSEQKGEIIVAYEGFYFDFEHIEYMEENGKNIKSTVSLDFDKNHSFTVFRKEQGADAEQDTSQVMGKTNMEVAGARFKTMTDVNSSRQPSTTNDTTLTTGKSMAERIQDLNLQSKPSNQVGLVSISSLKQAILSEDPTLLDSCLSVSDESTIKQTVAELPSPLLKPFITILTQRIQQSNQSGARFALAHVLWLRTVLITHTAYLVSLGDLVELLTPLYNALDSRLSSFGDLLSLHGRLDLVSTMAEQATYGKSISKEPLNEYVAGEGLAAIRRSKDQDMSDSDDSDGSDDDESEEEEEEDVNDNESDEESSSESEQEIEGEPDTSMEVGDSETSNDESDDDDDSSESDEDDE